jgi:hypothetical protein
VPEISRFFGIIITINYREHDPPHFYAWYAGSEISVRIADGNVSGHMHGGRLRSFSSGGIFIARSCSKTGNSHKQDSP